MMWIIIDRPMIDGQSIAINDIEYRGWLIFIGGGDYVESVVPGGASQATLPAKTLPAKTVSTWLSTVLHSISRRANIWNLLGTGKFPHPTQTMKHTPNPNPKSALQYRYSMRYTMGSATCMWWWLSLDVVCYSSLRVEVAYVWNELHPSYGSCLERDCRSRTCFKR